MTKDKVALVTGASRGNGAAIAIGLAKRGYDLALNDIPSVQDDLESVSALIQETDQRVETFLADVSNKAEVESMAANVLNAFGQVDAIVNNAGILIAGEMDGLPENVWDAVMDVNAKGSFW